jgi:hypothetical protein
MLIYLREETPSSCLNKIGESEAWAALSLSLVIEIDRNSDKETASGSRE